ncbi:hypothetical protein PPERSA_13003 [Pseudocohnilembus persalinus]|uniref:GAF domain-containing protein n=1 Tax=Pseudocohnilembus persalinus TaxID=266149 RepID=A0A0V0R2G3_PSEPJ|nr:hypothetical protein PPERSA_13003 [Pseudocohnilembus persalinus]|eukprot:KRX08522.1 hypothetical protein PPERSA_13003 [Pseudocohnilembus persalinus]
MIDQEFKYQQMKKDSKEDYQLNQNNIQKTKLFLEQYILELENEIKLKNKFQIQQKKQQEFLRYYQDAQSKQQSDKFLQGKSKNLSQKKDNMLDQNIKITENSIENNNTNNISQEMSRSQIYLLEQEQIYDKEELLQNLSVYMKYMEQLEKHDIKMNKIIQQQEKLIEFYSFSNKKKEDQLKQCNQEIIKLKNQIDKIQIQKQPEHNNLNPIIPKLQIGNLSKNSIFIENQQSDRNKNQVKSKLQLLNSKKPQLLPQKSHEYTELNKSHKNQGFSIHENMTQTQLQNRKSIHIKTPRNLISQESVRKIERIQSPSMASKVSLEIGNDIDDDQQQFFINHSNEFSNFQVLLSKHSENEDENVKQQFFDQKNLKIIKNHFHDSATVLQHIECLKQGQLQSFAQQISYTFQCLEMSVDIILKLKQIIYAVSSMHNSFSIQDAFLNIINETCKILSCDRASVFLIDPKREQLWTKVAKGVNTIYVPFGKGFVGSVVETKKIVNVMDAKKDKRFNPEIDRKSGYSTQSVLCTPIYDKNNQDIIEEEQEYDKNLGFIGKCYKEGQILNIQNSNSHVEQNLIVDIDTDLPIVCIPVKTDESTRNLLEKDQEIIGVIQFINPRGIDTLLYSKSQNLQNGQIFFESIKNFTDMLASNITNIYYQQNQEQKTIKKLLTIGQLNENDKE